MNQYLSNLYAANKKEFQYPTDCLLLLQTDLQRAIENEEKLKLAQTAEMQEVENYVEHIRHLSDEREALIQELETENDQLKQEIESLKADQNGEYTETECVEL